MVLRLHAVLLFGVLGLAPLSAQQDSLLHVWQDGSRPDSLRMQAAGEALRTLIYQHPDSALRLSMDLYDRAVLNSDRRRQAFALNFKGMAYMLMGNHYPAVLAYRDMLALYEQLDDRRGVAGAHSNLGTVFHGQGDLVRALEHYERCVPEFEALGDLRGKAVVANNLSGIHREMGDTASARRVLERLLREAMAADDAAGMAGAYGNLGLLAQDRGQLRTALELFRAGLRQRTASGDRAGKAVVQHEIGDVLRELGQLDSARSWIEASIALRDSIGDEPGSALAQVSLGLLALEHGRAQEAVALCERAAASAIDLQLRSVEQKACACLVKACSQTGNQACAERSESRLAVLNDSLQRRQARDLLARIEFRRDLVADSLRKASEAGHPAPPDDRGAPPWAWILGVSGLLGVGLWWWMRRRRA